MQKMFGSIFSFFFPLCERRHFFRHFDVERREFLTSPRWDFRSHSQILMSRTATYVCWESFDAISLLYMGQIARKLNKSTCYKPSTLKIFDFAFFFFLVRAIIPKKFSGFENRWKFRANPVKGHRDGRRGPWAEGKLSARLNNSRLGRF